MVHHTIILANLLAIASATPFLRRQALANTTVVANPAAGAEPVAVPLAGVSVTAPGVAVTDLATTTASQNVPRDASTFFQGDGLQFPTRDQWAGFDELFRVNLEVMGTNCVGNVAPNSAEENESIRKVILELAPITGVDPRFILVMIMQESNGCVRVKGTPSGEPGVFNPGLLQTFKGNGTCNGDAGEINPCSENSIRQMLIDGVQGTIQEGIPQAGIVQRLNEAGGNPAGQVFYEAARLYNSGSIADRASLETAGQCGPPRLFGVPCYSSDIANRLLGWIRAPTQCTLEPEASC